MRFLRTNTAVIITVGPFYDKTDGVTLETALTITNEKITLTADTDDGSAPTNVLDNVTGATSGTSNDLNYITGNDAGMMQMELSAANVNRLGRLFLSITDSANHVPVFHEFMVMPALVYDTFFASSGGATFPAATLASTTGAVASVTGAVGSVTGAVGSVTGAVGSVTGAVGSVTGAVGSVTGNVGGNVVGSVGSVTGAVGSVTGLTAANLDATISSRATPAQVKTQVVDALSTDTYAEPGQGAPAATATLGAKIGYLYKAWRNKKDNDGTTTNLYADDATTVDQKQATSSAGGTVAKGEWAAGP